jgi:hypothetical protein
MPARLHALPATAKYQAPPGHRCTPSGQCAAGCGPWPCDPVVLAATTAPPHRPRPIRRTAKPRRPKRDWTTLALAIAWVLLAAAAVWALALATRHPGGVLHAGVHAEATRAFGT